MMKNESSEDKTNDAASGQDEPVVSVRTFGTWEKTECDECGIEYQVTRTQPKEMESCICSDCEIYNSAYREGYEAGLKSAKPRYLCKAH